MNVNIDPLTGLPQISDPDVRIIGRGGGASGRPGGEWGEITGDLENQTDLVEALEEVPVYTQPSNIIIGGHSYIDPAGVGIKNTPRSKFSVGSRIISMLGLPRGGALNLAKSGAAMRAQNTNGAPRYLQAINPGTNYLVPSPKTGLSFMWIGTNDIIIGTGAVNEKAYKGGLRSYIARMKASSVFGHSNSTVVRTGTWTEKLWSSLTTADDVRAWGSGTGCWESSTVGDSITINLPSDLFTNAKNGLWIDLGFISAYAAGTVDISLNGVSQGSLVTSGSFGSTLGTSRGSEVFRVFCPVGSTQIVATITSLENGGPVRFNYWQIESLVTPLILLGECTTPPNPKTIWAGVTPANVDIMNSWINAVIAEYNDPAIRLVPLDDALNGQNIRALGQGVNSDFTYYSQDGLHPNDRGAMKVAEQVSKSIYTAIKAGVNREQLAGYFNGEKETVSTGDVTILHGDGQPQTLEYDFNEDDTNQVPAGLVENTGGWGVFDNSLAVYYDLWKTPVFTDDFNRANGAVGNGWTSILGTWEIQGNELEIDTKSGSTDQLILSPQQLDVNGDGYVEGKVGTVRENFSGIFFRYLDANNYWSLYMSVSFGTWVLRKRVAGVNTVVQNGGMGTPASGTVMHVELNGSQIKVFRAGVLQQTITDSDLQTERGCGVVAQSTGAAKPTWDDFKVLDEPTDTTNQMPWNHIYKDFAKSDGVFQYVVGTAADNNSCIFRYVDKDNYIELAPSVTFGNYILRKNVGGTVTTVLNPLRGLNESGTIISIVMDGDDFRFYFNGDETVDGMQTIASAPTGTKHGFRVSTGKTLPYAAFDDISFGDVYAPVVDNNFWFDDTAKQLYGPFIGGVAQQTIDLSTGIIDADDVDDSTSAHKFVTSTDITKLSRTITGTANQITVTNGDGVAGNPTLSTPQNIHTGASPTFAALTSTGTVTAGNMTSPDATATGTERFGAGATATGQNSTAFGSGATATTTNSVVIGRQASDGGNSGAVSLGFGATSTGANSFSLGRAATAAIQAIAIGYQANAGFSSSMAFGRAATTTANNQFVAGATTYTITNVFFGNGVTDAAPVGFTLNGTGGSGTDIAGANLTIAGGRGTGSGAGGSILFQTTPAGASGSTLRTLTTRMTIDATGLVTVAGNLAVSDEAYGGSWDGSSNVPTKNAIYDKIESMVSGSGLTAPQVASQISIRF